MLEKIGIFRRKSFEKSFFLQIQRKKGNENGLFTQNIAGLSKNSITTSA
jgi:hypothetical protein